MKLSGVECLMKPLDMPHLPSKPVNTVIMAGDAQTYIKALQTLNIEVLATQRNKVLEETISYHADMLCFHIGCLDILLALEQMFLYEELCRLGFKPQIMSKPIKSPYPTDALLNSARLERFLVFNPKTASELILKDGLIKNLELIEVKQGYTKCSVCIVNKSAIITEDLGIKKACENKGIDTLLISKGCVKLGNYAYGFFGGCTGLIDKNKLAVCGNIKNHKDYLIINQFLKKYDVEPICLSNTELIDIGGILPIAQTF